MNNSKNKGTVIPDWASFGNSIQIDRQLYSGKIILQQISLFSNFISAHLASSNRFFHIIAQNNINTIIAFFTARSCGLIPVLHDPGITKSELDESFSSTPPAVILNNQADSTEFDLNTLAEFKNVASENNLPQPSENSMLVLYTAGEDGYLKPALLTEANIICNARACIERARVDNTSTFITLAPLASLYGFQSAVILPLMAGCHSVLVSSDKLLKPGYITDIFHETKVTHVFTVPIIIYLLLKAPDLKKSLEFNRFFLSGGSVLSKELAEKFQARTGHHLQNGLGLTECSPYCFHNDPAITGYSDAIGTPLSCCQAKIVDEKNKTLPPDKIGEICIKGPHVFSEYYGFPEYTSAKLKDGWFFTGDQGWCTKEGIYFFHGLKKRMLNSGGKNVYPSEIERQLGQFPKIKSVKVSHRTSEFGNDLIFAEVTAWNNSEEIKNEIINWMKTNISRYKTPKIIEKQYT